jgi:hypothetical protein
MSFLIPAPEMVAAAATDLARVGSTLSAANLAAVAPISSVIAAGRRVSATIAALFGAHAHAYQTLSAQAATFHQQLVQARRQRGHRRPAVRPGRHERDAVNRDQDEHACIPIWTTAWRNGFDAQIMA